MAAKSMISEPAHLAGDLKTLFLSTVASHWEAMARDARKQRLSHVDYLADLMRIEVERRSERRVQRRIKDAKFPYLKTLDSFDLDQQAGLDRDEVLELFRCGFAEKQENVVLLGGVGTGKTHLAIALGLACCQREMRVRFMTAAEATNSLVEAKAQDRLSRKLEQLARFDVLVLDELGYVPFDREGSDLLFGLIARVYERRSLIVTTNLAFSKWGEVFKDAQAAAAVVDRVVHRATVLKTEGQSYRLSEAKARGRKRARRKTKK